MSPNVRVGHRKLLQMRNSELDTDNKHHSMIQNSEAINVTADKRLQLRQTQSVINLPNLINTEVEALADFLHEEKQVLERMRAGGSQMSHRSVAPPFAKII